MITLCFHYFGDLLAKRGAAPLDFFGVEIPERSSNSGFKGLDARVIGYITLFFNQSELARVTYIQIW